MNMHIFFCKVTRSSSFGRNNEIRATMGEKETKYHHINCNSFQQIAIPFMKSQQFEKKEKEEENFQVESCSKSFLSIPFFAIWHNLEYIIYAQIVNIQEAAKMLKKKRVNVQANTQSNWWRVINKMEFNGPWLANTHLGILSAFDQAFNLLKLQFEKLEKNSEMISLFFAVLCTSTTIHCLFSIHFFIFFFQFAKCNFIYFFSFYFFDSSLLFNSNFFFLHGLLYDSYSI